MKQDKAIKRLPAILIQGRWFTVAQARDAANKEVSRGNVQEAVDILGLIAAKVPDDFSAYFNRALLFQKMRRLNDAVEDMDRVLALKPDYSEAHIFRGILLENLKRPTEALASYDKAIELEAENAQAYNNRGITLQSLGRHVDALASLDKAIQLKTDYAEAYSNRGLVLQNLKRFDEAMESFDKALALKPGYFEAYLTRGFALIVKGNLPEAEKMYEIARALRPDSVSTLSKLVNLRKYQDVDHPDLKNMRLFLDKPGLSLQDKQELYFALGRAYDACGHYDQAFEYYRQVNEIRKKNYPYDPDAFTKLTSAIIAVFDQELLASSFEFASSSRSPLFLIGMPRTGTTLLASILSNHPSIASAGELNTIHELLTGLPKTKKTELPFPEVARELTAPVATHLINEYLQRLQRDVGPGVPYIIDKNPVNFRYLGLIAMLFPKARIIHCTRHPLDTGLSNYFQMFKDIPYSSDLRHIGHFYLDYRRLMDHWKKTLPMEMLEIKYEDTIRNTEKIASEMLDWLGLEWDERCLAPHTNPTPVETSSFWQVRQPIYTHALERWRNYEKHLDPLKEVLGLKDPPALKQEEPVNGPPAVLVQGRELRLAEASAAAEKEASQGNLPEAIDIYSLIIGKDPNDVMAYFNRARLLNKTKRLDEALTDIKKALELKPDYAEAYNAQGMILQELSRDVEALASYNRSIELNPKLAEVHSNRGVTLQNMQLYEDSLKAFDQAIALKPDFFEAIFNRSSVLVVTGDIAEAKRALVKARALRPHFPGYYVRMAKIHKYKDVEHEDVKAMRGLLNRQLSPNDREEIYFGLGKIYDDCGRYDEAFEYFRQGNQLMNSTLSYNSAAITDMANRTMEVFTKEFLAGPFDSASESRRPLFILGMPRSGTTLIATMLSNHRCIETAGELSIMAWLASHIPKLAGTELSYPEATRILSPAVTQRMINDYLKRLTRDAKTDVSHVIDKRPLNFNYIGLITILFPKARIIHCTRDPLDTSLSNYFAKLSRRLDYSFDLWNIGHFYGQYARLMEHWKKVLPVEMIEVSYRDTVTDTEGVARKVLDQLGLDWDERCLAPHTNPSAVDTASSWQVRQPIYTQSLERWRNYEKHLGPLKEMLSE